jgi:hypothetical protein
MNNSVPKPHRQNLLNKITKLYFISKYMWLVFFFVKLVMKRLLTNILSLLMRADFYSHFCNLYY